LKHRKASELRNSGNNGQQCRSVAVIWQGQFEKSVGLGVESEGTRADRGGGEGSYYW